MWFIPLSIKISKVMFFYLTIVLPYLDFEFHPYRSKGFSYLHLYQISTSTFYDSTLSHFQKIWDAVWSHSSSTSSAVVFIHHYNQACFLSYNTIYRCHSWYSSIRWAYKSLRENNVHQRQQQSHGRADFRCEH